MIYDYDKRQDETKKTKPSPTKENETPVAKQGDKLLHPKDEVDKSSHQTTNKWNEDKKG
jgi:hypothetical protein